MGLLLFYFLTTFFFGAEFFFILLRHLVQTLILPGFPGIVPHCRFGFFLESLVGL